jgi:hypothetical protein
VFKGFTGAFSLAVSLVEAEATSFHGLGDIGISGGLEDAIRAEELVAKGESSVGSKLDVVVVMYLSSQYELQLRLTVTDVKIEGAQARGLATVASRTGGVTHRLQITPTTCYEPSRFPCISELGYVPVRVIDRVNSPTYLGKAVVGREHDLARTTHS